MQNLLEIISVQNLQKMGSFSLKGQYYQLPTRTIQGNSKKYSYEYSEQKLSLSTLDGNDRTEYEKR